MLVSAASLCKCFSAGNTRGEMQEVSLNGSARCSQVVADNVSKRVAAEENLTLVLLFSAVLSISI